MTRVDYGPDQTRDEILNTGDFFGIIGCMSNKPRIETASAMVDTTLLRIRRENVLPLIQRNTSIVTKIIRFFSKRLREHDHKIRETALQVTTAGRTDLYDIALYFLKTRKKTTAKYALLKYADLLKTKGGAISEAEKKRALDAVRKLKELADIKIEAPRDAGGQTREYKAGSIICVEDEPGDCLFILKDGKVSVSKIINDREVLLDVMHEGDVFGEMALLDEMPRSATAIADVDSRVMVIDKTNFQNLIMINSQLIMKVFSLLSLRMWAAVRHIMNLNFDNLEYRVFDFLWFYFLKEGAVKSSAEKYVYDFNMKDFVKMLGLPADKCGDVRTIVMKEKIIDEDAETLTLANEVKLGQLVETLRNIYDRRHGKN